MATHLSTPAASDLGQARGARLSMAGVYVILFVLGVRCTVATDPFPGWSGDPLELEAPITGITPAFSLGLDVLTLLAAAVVLWGSGRRGWTARWWETLCLAGGAVVVGVYAFVPHRATLENLVLGSNWLAAMAGAFACLQAARDTRARRAIVAALVGLLGILIIRAGYQVHVEHPQVYREFLRNKAQIISSQGWSEGSPMALAYERRIRQVEATAWFGLSNVFATVAAAGLTLATGLTVAAWRQWRSSREREPSTFGLMAMGVLTAACGYAVYLAQSKGGLAAAGLGLVLLAVFHGVGRFTFGRFPRVLGFVAALIPFAAIAAVVLRGLVGERIDELSLLFRSFYLEGAARIIEADPLLGTGPAGFKDAYIVHKPPLSPEEVSSPHSLFVDFVATLGIGGLGWCVLVLSNAYRAGAALVDGRDVSGRARNARGATAEEPSLREEARALFILFAAVTAAGAMFEHRIAMIDTTLLRFAAMGVATALAGVTVAVARGAGPGTLNPTIAAAALAALTHTQIELTGVTPGANLYVFLLLATAAAPALSSGVAAAGRWGRLPAPALVVLSAAALVWQLRSAFEWERHLRAAAAVVEPVRDLTSRHNAVVAGQPLGRDTPGKLALELAEALGTPVEAAGIPGALSRLRFERTTEAANELAAAAGSGLPDFQTARAASRLLVLLATLEHSRGRVEQSRTLGSAAESQVLAYMSAAHPTAPAYAWLGLVQKTLRPLEVGTDRGALQAVDAFEKAAALSPYEPSYRLELARLLHSLPGEAAKAKAAERAREALWLNENFRLDPVRQFGSKELAELKSIAAGSANPGQNGPSTPPVGGTDIP